MPLAAILVGIAMIGLVFSAVFFAAAYYSIGRLIEPRRRSIVSGVVAAIASVIFILSRNGDGDVAMLLDPRIWAALIPWLLGIALWAWRTHVADLREVVQQ